MSHSVASPDESALTVEQLPPPELPKQRFPQRALLQGLLSAVCIGGLLYLGWTWVYLDLLFDFVVGVLIGWAVSNGLQSAFYPRRPQMAMLTIGCVFLAYFVYNAIHFSIQVMNEGQFQLFLSESPQATGFNWELLSRPFLVAMEKRSFLGEFPLPIAGTLIVWVLDFAIASYVAWTAVDLRIRLQQLHAVPPAVVRYLLAHIREGYKRPELESWLSKSGWQQAAEQQAAFDAVIAWGILRKLNRNTPFPGEA